MHGEHRATLGRLRAVCWLQFALLTPIAHAAVEVSSGARLKLFANTVRLSAHDVRLASGGRLQSRIQVDARGHLALTTEHWRAELDGELTGMAADARRLSAANDPYAANDGQRYFDFARVADANDQHALRGRIDRLVLGYRNAQFAFAIGRQAVSWGNGLVFQPFDLLNPFAPTETDRDYKLGDDLALLQWTSVDNRDLQVIAVARRTSNGERQLNAGSVGAKWQQPLGSGELSLLIAQHAGDAVFGAGWNMPLGDAVARIDWVSTRLDAGTWRHCLVMNADKSFIINEHNVYGFIEIYRNGFGEPNTPRALAQLTAPLQRRLQRGEVFTLSRWYGAFGATVEWTPLWQQTALLILSAQDGSALVQATLRYEPDDHAVLEAGVTWGAGGTGDEFAGVPVLRAAPQTPTTTLGGGLTAHLRWSWYW